MITPPQTRATRPARATRRRIDSRVGQLAYAPNVRKALKQLGYTVVEVATHVTEPPPDLRIADDRDPDSLPSTSTDPRTPIVLLTGSAESGACGASDEWIHDPRVVGRVRRPAKLAELYRVVQQAVETHPRLTPRVTTELPARIMRRDQGWLGAVVTLSERGCMTRTSERLAQGDRVQLHFSLSSFGLIDTSARVIWSQGQNAGLVFADNTNESRCAIDAYVSQKLAGAE